MDLPKPSNESPSDTKCCKTRGQERLFRKVTSVSIHSFVEWLDTFSYVLRPADVTVKEVNHIRCFAIDIAKDLILLSCRLAMEHLCVLQLEKLPPGVQRNKNQQTGSPCSRLPSLFRENFRHCPSSLERNWKKWNAGQFVPWTTRCSVPATKSIKDTLVRAAVSRPSSTVSQCKPCGDKCCKCCLQLKNEWTQKWPYEKDSLARESTLCVARALIGWLW